MYKEFILIALEGNTICNQNHNNNHNNNNDE